MKSNKASSFYHNHQFSNTSANTSTLAISPLIAQQQPQRRLSDTSNSKTNNFNTSTTSIHNHNHLSHVPSPLQQQQKDISLQNGNVSGSIDSRIFNNDNSDLYGNNHNNNSNGNNISNDTSSSVAFTSTFQPLSQADKLRLWRHDALMQHHYNTACYIGDKVYDLTKDPNDAFWLAQVHHSTGNFLRAHQLLSSTELLLQSVSCRYLNALCLTKLKRWDEALDLLGESNPFRNINDVNGEIDDIKNQDGGIKLESSMCYLRGVIFGNQNKFERAKECFKEAVLIDVKCFEAFNELIKNHFLTPEEEWQLLNDLKFDELDNNSELIKHLYTTRLNKYINLDKIRDAELLLNEDYALQENTDILIANAELLFTQCKFTKCLEICEKILNFDEFNFDIFPTYLSCLHELGGKNKIFLVANKLSESYPTESVTWLSIGIYYLSIGKITDSRRFFSKASLSTPNFGQAWIGFAHTFAAEGEHEQAISAYSTAARLFPGTHLPNLFLGMQYLQMGNLILAEEYMLTAYNICSADPLLMNEIGVVYFHKNDFKNAEKFLLAAKKIAKDLNNDSKSWISINSNLGHVYRKVGKYHDALKSFQEVLKLNVKDANIFSAIGLIYLKLGKIFKSIEALHKALAISPNDPISSDLLKRALEKNASDERFSSPASQEHKIPLNNSNNRNKLANFNSYSTVRSRSNHIANAIKTNDYKDLTSTPLPKIYKNDSNSSHRFEDNFNSDLTTSEFFNKASRIIKLSKDTMIFNNNLNNIHNNKAKIQNNGDTLAADTSYAYNSQRSKEKGIYMSKDDNPAVIARNIIRGEVDDDDASINDDAMVIEDEVDEGMYDDETYNVYDDAEDVINNRQSSLSNLNNRIGNSEAVAARNSSYVLDYDGDIIAEDSMEVE